MSDSAFDLAEKVEGSVQNRGRFQRVKSILALDSFDNPERVLYSSVFLQCEYVIRFRQERPKDRYEGPVRAEFVHFDFDSKDEPERAFLDAQALLQRLTGMGYAPDSLRCYFSGSKGFHVYLLDEWALNLLPGPKVPAQVLAAAQKLAEGLPTWDAKVYDHTRIFRVPNSQHQETGLFKVPIPISKMLEYGAWDLGDIRDQAKEPIVLVDIGSAYHTGPQISQALAARPPEVRPAAAPAPTDGLLSLVQAGIPEGKRNATLTSLAGLLFKKGLDRVLVGALIRGINHGLATRLEDREIDTLLASVSRYHPQPEKGKDGFGGDADRLLWPEEARRIFLEGCRKDEKGILFGLTLVDSVIGGLRKGETLGLVANPGCFKTATLQNMLIRAQDCLAPDEFVAFFSMDMKTEREYQRRVQILEGFRGTRQMRRAAKDGDPEFLGRLEAADRRAAAFATTDRRKLNVQDMIQIIRNTEQATGKKCRLVGIDYLDKIQPPNVKAFNPVGDIMDGLSDMAFHLDLSTILLVQTNKAQQGNSTEDLNTRDAKGGTSIDQEVDFLMRLWFKDKAGQEVVGRFKKHRRLEGGADGWTGAQKPFPFFRLLLEAACYRLQDIQEISEEEATPPKKKAGANGEAVPALPAGFDAKARAAGDES